MAVPKKKTSRSKGGMRRSHMRLKLPNLTVDKKTGLFTMPHRICPSTGRYKDKVVVEAEEI